MFIKIQVMKKSEDKKSCVVRFTKIIECLDFNLNDGDFDGEEKVMLNAFDRDGSVIFGGIWYTKWQTRIYVMNNSGKTIDQFVWDGLFEEEMKKNSN